MGKHRGKHQDKSSTEVSVKLSKAFNVRQKDLYSLWLAYNNRVIVNGNPRLTINQLSSHPEMYSPEAMNYFTALGFELFNKEYLKGISVGR